MKKRPHIIIFNPDQMQNAALAHMGENSAAQTPFLDRLAESEAISYRNAFCQNPVCVPSRCSFLTGLYPHIHGNRTMNHMLHHQSTILQELKNAGYYVWMNARNDFLPAQEEGVFNEHVNEVFYGGDIPPASGTKNLNPRGGMGDKNYYSHYGGKLRTDENGRNYNSDDEIVDAAIRRIKHPVDDKPFFLFLGLIYPHPEYKVEEPYFSAIDRSKLPLRIKKRKNPKCEPKIEKMIRENQRLWDYTEEDWDELRACYAGMCKKVDEQFERFCNGLKEAGIYDDCAIFFFSDHGDYQGQFGLSEKNQNTFEDCLTRVPLLIKPPKDWPVDPGISDSLVELTDFYATAMEFAGVNPDHTHFGKSLTENMKERSRKVRDYVCCEGGRLENEIHCDESHASGPDGIGKISAYWPRLHAQEDAQAHTKATMLRTKKYKYVRRLYEEDQLFDMENDPYECEDVIADEAKREILNEMRILMLDWYQQTCDIVPFTYDNRFNYEMIWNRVKYICPPEHEAKVKQAIRKGEMAMFEIIKWCHQLKQEKEQ